MIQITVECNSYPRFYDGTFICKNCGCITFHCGTSVLPLGWTKEEYYSGGQLSWTEYLCSWCSSIKSIEVGEDGIITLKT